MERFGELLKLVTSDEEDLCSVLATAQDGERSATPPFSQLHFQPGVNLLNHFRLRKQKLGFLSADILVSSAGSTFGIKTDQFCV